jgi:hypothetical protein
VSDTRVVLVVLALLASMALAYLVARRHRIGIVLLALQSVLWLLVNSDFEGPTLVDFSRTHGLTMSDLLGIAGLLLAGWLLVRRQP